MSWGDNANSQDAVNGLTQKISELEEKRNNLINIVEGSISDAKQKADKIIQDAITEAIQIVVSANQVKKDADDYLDSKKKEADGVIADAHIFSDTISKVKSQLESEKKDFELNKNSEQLIIDTNRESLDAREKDLESLKLKLDNLSMQLESTRKYQSNKQDELNKDCALLSQAQTDFSFKQKDINSQIQQLNNYKDSLSKQQDQVNVLLKDASDKQEKANLLLKSNSDISENLKARQSDLDNQQSSIKTQLANLDIQKQSQIENDKTQNEMQQSLDYKMRELNKKIQTLNDLRNANGS